MSPVENAPITAVPTLIAVPSFSIPAEPPALAPIPTSAAKELATLVDQANAITAEEASVAHSLHVPNTSFIEDEEDDFGLEEFYAPKPKGKAKAVPPAPVTAPASDPAPAPVATSTSAPASSASAGPSVDGILKRIGYDAHSKAPNSKRWGTDENKQTARNGDALAMGLVEVDGRLVKLRKDVEDIASGVDARLVGIAADIADGGARTSTADPSYAIPTLIAASNQHTTNANKMTSVIHDIVARIRELEKQTAAITALEASVASLDRGVKVALNRLSAASGSAPSAPSAADATVLSAATATEDARIRAIVEDAINSNGKRGRAEDEIHVEDPAKRHHPGITMPAAFALPTAPPAPDFAAPAFAPPAVPPAPSSAVATPPPAPPASTTALPRAPPGGPPRVKIDPAREVLFGPMDWEEKWNLAPRNLILNVLTHNTMRNARFTSRRGPDDATVILVFEADNVASWFIATWNGSPRAGYEICTARPMSLNA